MWKKDTFIFGTLKSQIQQSFKPKNCAVLSFRFNFKSMCVVIHTLIN